MGIGYCIQCHRGARVAIVVTDLLPLITLPQVPIRVRLTPFRKFIGAAVYDIQKGFNQGFVNTTRELTSLPFS